MGSCEIQQLVDDVSGTANTTAEQSYSLTALLHVNRSRHAVQLEGHGGQWCPELVRRLSDEAAFVGHRSGGSVHLLVERDHEALQLLRGAIDLEGSQVGGFPRVHVGCQLAHRCEHPAHGNGEGDRQQWEQDQKRQDGGQGSVTGDSVARSQRLGRHDGEPGLTVGNRHRRATPLTDVVRSPGPVDGSSPEPASAATSMSAVAWDNGSRSVVSRPDPAEAASPAT